MQTLSSANCLLMNIFKKKKVIEFEYSSYIYTFVPPACIFTLHKIFHTNFICFSFLQIIPKRKREIKFMPVWKKFLTSTNICLHGCSPSLSLNFLMATISFVSCSRLKKEDASEGYVHKVNIFLYLLK